ncbi:MAG: hypothetical protein QW794_03000 [Thermosphaera sp.]
MVKGLQKKPLVIAIYDPDWFLNVQRLLKKRGVLFSHYYEPENIPYFAVFYTDYWDLVKDVIERKDLEIIYDPAHDCRKIERAVLAAYLIEEYRELIIGVDPGKYLTYVALGDGLLIDYGKADLLGFTRELKYFLECIPYLNARVKIGGSPKGFELIKILRRELTIPLEMVPEEKTTPSLESRDEIRYLSEKMKRGLRPFRFKDVYAAYRIAMKKGVEVV